MNFYNVQLGDIERNEGRIRVNVEYNKKDGDKDFN